MNNVIVGATGLYWSHGQFACSLEFGCPAGPTLTAYDASGDRVGTSVDGGVGTWRVAGTDTQLFYLFGESRGAMYVKRLDRFSNVALSIPRAELTGPTVDDAYVYWAENELPTRTCVIRKALRSGNGDDVQSIAVSAERIDNLTYAAGFLWWTESPSSVLKRVPVLGGAIEDMNVDAVTVISASDTSILIGRTVWGGAGTSDVAIGRVEVAGAYQVLITHPKVDRAPRYLVENGNTIFWSVFDGNIYSATPGGSISTNAAEDASGFAFVVLPDSLLVDFNRHGFRRIVR